MSSASDALFDALAPDYDEHFRVPHRRAYDELAWRAVLEELPPPPGPVVDVGCGVGRWAARLTSAGYVVVGVEPAAGMAAQARRRLAGRDFTLHECPAEQAEIRSGSASAVLAMGSLQYADDFSAVVARVAGWVRPGGVLCLLTDSLVALAAELVHDGREAEAHERLTSRRGVWRQAGLAADLHLLDAAALRAAVVDAGLVPEQVLGLLVGASVHGRRGLRTRLEQDYEARLGVEWALAHRPELADLGKQLLVVARPPRLTRPAERVSAPPS